MYSGAFCQKKSCINQETLWTKNSSPKAPSPGSNETRYNIFSCWPPFCTSSLLVFGRIHILPSRRGLPGGIYEAAGNEVSPGSLMTIQLCQQIALAEFGDGQRPGKIVALSDIAIEEGQQMTLLSSFNPFGYRAGVIECLSHADGMSDYGMGAVVGYNAVYQAFVDFDIVKVNAGRSGIIGLGKVQSYQWFASRQQEVLIQ